MAQQVKDGAGLLVCPACGKDDFKTPLAAAYCCLESD